ncbi:hypothetical protein RHDE110596_22515 [Prescottella defluvii]|nr:hypothetical protein [Prescottella defluvii]
MNAPTETTADAVEYRGPHRVWNVGPEAVVTLTGHPFDGLQITHWSVD